MRVVVPWPRQLWRGVSGIVGLIAGGGCLYGGASAVLAILVAVFRLTSRSSIGDGIVLAGPVGV